MTLIVGISLAVIAIVLCLLNIYMLRSWKRGKQAAPRNHKREPKKKEKRKKIIRIHYPGWKTCEAVGRSFGIEKNASSQVRDICLELNLDTKVMKGNRFMKEADIPYVEERLKEKRGAANKEPTLFEVKPEWVSGAEMMQQFGIKHKNTDYYRKRYSIERKGDQKHYLFKQADIDTAVTLRKKMGLQ